MQCMGSIAAPTRDGGGGAGGSWFNLRRRIEGHAGCLAAALVTHARAGAEPSARGGPPSQNRTLTVRARTAETRF